MSEEQILNLVLSSPDAMSAIKIWIVYKIIYLVLETGAIFTLVFLFYKYVIKPFLKDLEN